MHRHYRRLGKISDSDLLYTLSLFALEPSRWVSRFEWRELTDLELCAVGTLWRNLGEALEVPFGELPSFAPLSSSVGDYVDDGAEKVKAKETEKEIDGLQWLEELRVWSQAYEEKHMVPADSNKRLADSTLRLILWKLPSSLHGIGKNILATLLEDKLREAML